MTYRELVFLQTWGTFSWLNLKLESGEISMSDNKPLKLFFKVRFSSGTVFANGHDS